MTDHTLIGFIMLGMVFSFLVGIALWLKWMGRRLDKKYHRGKYGSIDALTGDMTGRSNMGTMTINGRTFTGSNIQMSNGRIIVDGKDVTNDTGVDLHTFIEIKVTGDIQHLTTDKNVTVHGDVTGDVNADGSVNCDKVGGNISAGGSISADDVKGNVKAGGSVSCDDVGGSVQAGGSVNHG